MENELEICTIQHLQVHTRAIGVDFLTVQPIHQEK